MSNIEPKAALKVVLLLIAGMIVGRIAFFIFLPSTRDAGYMIGNEAEKVIGQVLDWSSPSTNKLIVEDGMVAKDLIPNHTIPDLGSQKFVIIVVNDPSTGTLKRFTYLPSQPR